MGQKLTGLHRSGKTLSLRNAIFALFSSSALILLSGCIERDEVAGAGRILPDRIVKSNGDAQSGVIGTIAPLPLSVRVYSKEMLPVENVKVIFTVESGSATVRDSMVKTNEDGYARTILTFGLKQGEVVAKATVQGLKGSPVEFSLDALPADASVITPGAGGFQVATVGRKLSNPLSVVVTDYSGNSVKDAHVQFVATVGGGTLTVTDAFTDSVGWASTEWTLGTQVGQQKMEARPVGFSAAPASFTATALADAPSALRIVSGNNQSNIIGSTLLEDFVVGVADQYDNPVSNVSVRFSIVVGDGALSKTTVVTNGAGIASTRLTLGTNDHENRVQVVVGSLRVMFGARGYTPVVLKSLAKTPAGIALTWSQNVNDDFLNFAIYRKTSEGVTTNDSLVATLNDSSATSYVDSTAVSGTQYFYRLFVNFSTGFILSTNELSITPASRMPLQWPGKENN